MAHKHQWTRYDAERLGLALMEALVRLKKGNVGSCDLDLEGRCLRIITNPSLERVILFEIGAPIELVDEVKGD